ncbi:MAG TPA: hypothetical protein PLJ47_09090 [Candidatus Hydrogenedentes bacterium]|nr:hypothetical protein [Candidatus Hydrogenedentota bacterium]
MGIAVQLTSLFRGRFLRVAALAAVAFLAIADSHEALLLLQSAHAEHSCEAPAKESSHSEEHSCAFCVLSSTPVLVTPNGVLPVPQAEETRFELALGQDPIARDAACFPHFRRGPPAL